jgi:hypothetical protein
LLTSKVHEFCRVFHVQVFQSVVLAKYTFNVSQGFHSSIFICISNSQVQGARNVIFDHTEKVLYILLISSHGSVGTANFFQANIISGANISQSRPSSIGDIYCVSISVKNHSIVCDA